MTGQRANTTPLATELIARFAGKLQTPIAMISPTISPASDACHAGRRRTPSSTRTVATGSAATINESGRLPATGVSNCLNISSPPQPVGGRTPIARKLTTQASTVFHKAPQRQIKVRLSVGLSLRICSVPCPTRTKTARYSSMSHFSALAPASSRTRCSSAPKARASPS